MGHATNGVSGCLSRPHLDRSARLVNDLDGFVERSMPLILSYTCVEHYLFYQGSHLGRDAVWKKRGSTLCGIVAALLLGTGTSDSGSTGGTSGGSGSSSVDLSATVRFTGTQFVITNNDTFDWTNVELEINSVWYPVATL